MKRRTWRAPDNESICLGYAGINWDRVAEASRATRTPRVRCHTTDTQDVKRPATMKT